MMIFLWVITGLVVLCVFLVVCWAVFLAIMERAEDEMDRLFSGSDDDDDHHWLDEPLP